MRILVTGGAGFIGSAVIRNWIANTNHTILNVDKLTYAGSEESLKELESEPRYEFTKIDIRDKKQLEKTIAQFKPHRIVHLAAESHVDRSVISPEDFISTNILGTFALLQVAIDYKNEQCKRDFLFHHVSTGYASLRRLPGYKRIISGPQVTPAQRDMAWRSERLTRA